MVTFKLTHNKRSDQRGVYSRFFVGECALTKLADEWFLDKEIHTLNFKCKTWKKVKRKISDIHRPFLMDELDADKIRYSRKAGCQCGCSPGYVVESSNYIKRWLYGDFEYTQADVQEFKIFLSKMETLLEKEKEKQLKTA